MMIKPLRSMIGSYGKLKRNVPKEVSDRIAQDLIRRGKAVPFAPEEASPGGAQNPLSDPAAPTGGQTGVVPASSSSPEDQVPETQTSTASERAPDASSSTTDGGSQDGQTSSTDATSPGGKSTKASRSSKD